MTQTDRFDIFLVCAPGLEAVLADEVRERGFSGVEQLPGGVQIHGHWQDVWRANLELRGATRVLARLGSFRAFHLAQLDKRARKFPWGDTLRPDVPLRVEVTCRKSKIYHKGAAAQRIETAIWETLGAPISAEAELQLKVRIDDNLCTISVDTSGESLHRRGHKVAVNKAPMRETMAAMFLCRCGFDGSEPVFDPMCGSGTFVIEAAEIASGLMPGRTRTFAFEQLATFAPTIWAKMQDAAPATKPEIVFHGSDRDAGAIKMSRDNAVRSGVDTVTRFETRPVSDITPPDGPAGLVIVNPPYGARIGNRKLLFSLYGALGQTLKERFSGWRVGIVTSDGGLAKATGLPFLPTEPPVAHGSLKVTLWRTDPLP